MAWDGDLSRMGKLVANLGRLTRVPAGASGLVSERLREAIEEQFDQGVDPYGNAWEPLAESTIARGRFPPPLTDTHDMRDSVAVGPLPGAGVAITIDHPAQIHQTGWSGRSGAGPARPVLPGAHFPPAWKEIIDDTIAEQINGTLQGAA